MSHQQPAFSQRNFLLQIYPMSFAIIVFYLVLQFSLGVSVTKLLLIACLGICFLVGYTITKRSVTTLLPAHFYVSCSYIGLFLNAMFTGGLDAPGFIWFLFCPLVAFISLSAHVARIWLFVIFVTVFLFHFSERYLVYGNFDGRTIWKLVTYVLFFLTSYIIVNIFRREVSRKNVELNELNQTYHKEREALKRTQQEILFQSEMIRLAETKSRERNLKLSYYLDQMIEIKRMEELHSGSLEYSIPAVLRFLMKAMSLDSVSVWHVHNVNDKSLTLLRSIGNRRLVYEPAVLVRENFPEAYDMLATGAVISGESNSIEARQLSNLFYNASGKDSMINCPYFIEGVFAGFISCRATSLSYNSEDIIFIRAISEAIPLAFRSHFRREQQQLLEEKQREITRINESLERTVQQRTDQLNIRNQQLTNFAFTNAHHIRGPVCRLLGLRNLLVTAKDAEEIRRISQYMSYSIDELNNITHSTSIELNALTDATFFPAQS